MKANIRTYLLFYMLLKLFIINVCLFLQKAFNVCRKCTLKNEYIFLINYWIYNDCKNLVMHKSNHIFILCLFMIRGRKFLEINFVWFSYITTFFSEKTIMFLTLPLLKNIEYFFIFFSISIYFTGVPVFF